MQTVARQTIWSALVLAALRAQPTAADSAQPPVAHSARKEPAASAHSAAPALYLEVWATIQGSIRGPFVPDITLHAGDRISLQARTSSAAHVYLLHCAADGALSIYPDPGGIRFHAVQWVQLPAAGIPIQLGDQPGVEALYVVATREPLARADANLQRWLAHSLTQPGAKSCGDALDSALEGAALSDLSDLSDLSESRASPPPRAARQRTRFALRGVDLSKPQSPIARAFAERDGVVVLRLPYRHAQ